jgi:hypothetical protein
MKIFIINLKKDKDRFLKISEQLNRNNFFNYERVDAIYGKDVYKDYNTKLNPGQLGCYLSHLRTYSKIIEQNLEYAIILEDDVQKFIRLKELLNLIDKRKESGLSEIILALNANPDGDNTASYLQKTLAEKEVSISLSPVMPI